MTGLLKAFAQLFPLNRCKPVEEGAKAAHARSTRATVVSMNTSCKQFTKENITLSFWEIRIDPKNSLICPENQRLAEVLE